MNNIANRAVMCEVLMAEAARDKDLLVLCSDSRGSASMTPFAKAFPEQFVETGIAEQNLVSVAAGLAACGKRPFAISPASFLTTRSFEQAKVDCAYSNENVKLVGISGGVSYGALGMTHHACQDIAALAAVPNLRVYLPSDRHQTKKLFEALLRDEKPAYIRLGRNPVEDVYGEELEFTLDRACCAAEGTDVAIVACGEVVRPSLDAAAALRQEGISCAVLDMYCVKPLDVKTLLDVTDGVKLVVTVEEHAPFGGLGSMVSQAIAAHAPKNVINLSLPDAPVVTGTSKEVFAYYGLTTEGIAETIRRAWKG